MAISISQLDLEALKNYLKIVHGFRTVDDMSGDTEYVAQIAAELIAIAARDEQGDLILDRNTVQNALQLVKINEDGTKEYINGDYVLTEDEGRILKEHAVAAANHTADDMRALRNEMYQLKRDMIKIGAMAYDPVYNGFIDPFINMLNVHVEDLLLIEDIGGIDTLIVAGDTETYMPGQYAAIADSKNGIVVDRVSEASNSMLVVESGVFNFMPEKILKSFGIIDEGRFVFANDKAQVGDSEKEVNMIYKDGPERIKVAEINETAGIAGFATTMLVPAELDQNYLNGITLSLRLQGAPGSLNIMLYEYNDAMQYGDAIAVSNYLNAGLVTNEWRTYEFSFDKQILLEKGKEYLILIRANNTNSVNYWSIGGFTEVCNYNIHQDTYLYTINGQFAKEGPDLITNKIADAFIGLKTTSKLRTEYVYSNGLYTGAFVLENDMASRCRISINPRKNENIDNYKIVVKGRNGELDDYIFGKQVQRLTYNHTKWVHGLESGLEYCYDFIFDKEINDIEFQVIYQAPGKITEENYEALYSIVVATDNAYIKEV